jgi:hypothetical protein
MPGDGLGEGPLLLSELDDTGFTGLGAGIGLREPYRLYGGDRGGGDIERLRLSRGGSGRR